MSDLLSCRVHEHMELLLHSLRETATSVLRKLGPSAFCDLQGNVKPEMLQLLISLMVCILLANPLCQPAPGLTLHWCAL